MNLLNTRSNYSSHEQKEAPRDHTGVQGFAFKLQLYDMNDNHDNKIQYIWHQTICVVLDFEYNVFIETSPDPSKLSRYARQLTIHLYNKNDMLKGQILESYIFLQHLLLLLRRRVLWMGKSSSLLGPGWQGWEGSRPIRTKAGRDDRGHARPGITELKNLSIRCCWPRLPQIRTVSQCTHNSDKERIG